MPGRSVCATALSHSATERHRTKRLDQIEDRQAGVGGPSEVDRVRKQQWDSTHTTPFSERDIVVKVLIRYERLRLLGRWGLTLTTALRSPGGLWLATTLAAL